MDRQKEIHSFQEEIDINIKKLEVLKNQFAKISQDLKSIRAKSDESFNKMVYQINNDIEQLKATNEPNTWYQLPHTDTEDFKFVWDCESQENLTEVEKFIKRLEIADYCGRREFVKGQDNWYNYYRVDVDKWEVISATATIKYGVNHFPTKEAAEKYLKICLNSNLL